MMRLPNDPLPAAALPGRLAATAAAALLTLAACTADTTSGFDRTFSTPSDAALVLPSGGTWAIIKLGETPLPAGVRFTREGGRAGGFDGCAELGGGFATRGLGLDLPGITRTGAPSGAACGGVADQVLAALQAVNGVSVVSDGTLQLTANGQPLMTAQRVFRTIRAGTALQADPGPVTGRPASPATAPR